MIEDGEMDEIFNKYNSQSIEKVNMANRRVIEIRNHLLPAATPLDDDKLWFKPLN